MADLIFKKYIQTYINSCLLISSKQTGPSSSTVEIVNERKNIKQN